MASSTFGSATQTITKVRSDNPEMIKMYILMISIFLQNDQRKKVLRCGLKKSWGFNCIHISPNSEAEVGHKVRFCFLKHSFFLYTHAHSRAHFWL